jgi:hypothetical protein
MGRADRAPTDVEWEARFPSSSTSTAELCYLDGVLTRLRETRTHQLEEARSAFSASARSAFSLRGRLYSHLSRALRPRHGVFRRR